MKKTRSQKSRGTVPIKANKQKKLDDQLPNSQISNKYTATELLYSEKETTISSDWKEKVSK
jgi:hypothetical protein